MLHPFLGPRIHVRNRYSVTGPLSSGWSQNFHFRLTLIIFKSERFPINREAWKSDRSPGTKNDARPKLIAELIPRLLLQFYCAKNMASNLDNRFIPSHSPSLGIRVMYICFTWINYNIHFHVIKIMGIKFTRIRNTLYLLEWSVLLVCLLAVKQVLKWDIWSIKDQKEKKKSRHEKKFSTAVIWTCQVDGIFLISGI